MITLSLVRICCLIGGVVAPVSDSMFQLTHTQTASLVVASSRLFEHLSVSGHEYQQGRSQCVLVSLIIPDARSYVRVHWEELL